jgi:hypothetical protein
MKGTLEKTIKGQWVVRIISEETPECDTIIEHGKQLPVHPEYVKYYFLDEDADGSEVEFEIEDFYEQGMEEVVKVAKLVKGKVICEYSGLPSVTSYTTPEYPELEGTMELCNDKIWDDIYEEYSKEQYPAFGGPFTDSISFIDWLKLYYKVPEKK